MDTIWICEIFWKAPCHELRDALRRPQPLNEPRKNPYMHGCIPQVRKYRISESIALHHQVAAILSIMHKLTFTDMGGGQLRIMHAQAIGAHQHTQA
eukprot:5790019-Pleurochrysis_carterae.AAC.4